MFILRASNVQVVLSIGIIMTVCGSSFFFPLSEIFGEIEVVHS